MKSISESSEAIRDCIDSCIICAQSCKETIVFCIHKGGEHIEPEHLEMMMNCARVCEVSAELMTNNSKFSDQMCLLCAQICKSCEENCESFEEPEMKECAESCRECVSACKEMIREYSNMEEIDEDDEEFFD